MLWAALGLDSHGKQDDQLAEGSPPHMHLFLLYANVSTGQEPTCIRSQAMVCAAGTGRLQSLTCGGDDGRSPSASSPLAARCWLGSPSDCSAGWCCACWQSRSHHRDTRSPARLQQGTRRGFTVTVQPYNVGRTCSMR